jgi:citrate synthase
MTEVNCAELLQKAKQWWSTEIIDMKPGSIRFRGFPIEQLIGRISFPQMIWLMLRGDLPSPEE